MKNKINSRVALVAFGLLAALTACNKSGFTGGVQQGAVEPEPVPTGIAAKTERFMASAGRAPLDVVWVIDNSGSMSEEAAHVRTNLSRFIQTVTGRADVRVALLSRSGNSGTNVTMPSGPNLFQVPNSKVESTNALAIAAAASCDASSSRSIGPNSGTICGVPYNQVSGSTLEDSSTVASVVGTLRSFLRPEAKRVYVFVTDDEARGFTSNEFMQAMRNSGAPAVSVYGFVGMANRSGCTIAIRSQHYLQLSQMTGGTAYDLCEPDWSANFSQLSSNLVRSVQAGFNVSAPAIQRLIRVTVGGQNVDIGAVQVAGNRVELDASLIPDGNLPVEITYE